MKKKIKSNKWYEFLINVMFTLGMAWVIIWLFKALWRLIS